MSEKQESKKRQDCINSAGQTEWLTDYDETLWYWIGFQEGLGRESAKRVGGDVDRSDFGHSEPPTEPNLRAAYLDGLTYGQDERRSESLSDRREEEWEPDF